MKKGAILFAAACVLLTLVLLSAPGELAKSGRDKNSGARRTAQAQFVPDRLLVKFKDDANGMAAESGRVQAEYVHGLKRLKYFGRIGVHVYQTAGPFEKTLKALRKNPNVAYAEPDFILSIDATIPNDTAFGQLWGLNNIGQSGGTFDADIDAPEAWDLTTGNNSVVVAVIDTGVAYTHSDLNANMWVNPGETAGNGIDDDSNGYIDDIHGINSITGTGDPMDDHNHGTHCAGTIAAVGNNGIGVAGVCWTAKIMALKFIASSGTGANSDAIECIEYAVSKGAHILSNSWGSYDYGQALKDAVDDAGAAGILFIAAAGNDGYNNDGALAHYPASYSSPNIIAVAATNRNDALSVFSGGGSNYGPYSVDVAAPGSSIYSTIRGDAYGTMSGTSMATPHVAGLAALIKSTNFALNWMQIRDRILGGVDPLPALQGKVLTGGRINAYNSLIMGDVDSYLLNVTSSPAAGAAISVSPADLDGSSSGTTDFTRRYTPYTAAVTLTAPGTHLGRDFGFWRLEGSHYSGELSVTAPTDFDHVLNAFYVVPLPEAIDNAALEVVAGGIQNGFYGQGDTSYHGGDAAQSFVIGDSQSGFMQTTVHGPGDLSFYWKVSSESGFDFLRYRVDSVEIGSISGEVDWQRVEYSLGPGPHLIQWVYSKDAGASAGSDCGWVDYVQFGGAPATLAQALDSGVSTWATGGNGGWYYQALYSQYDADAAQSSVLSDGQEAFLETTATGPTPLSFYWRVSSESGWDYLRFYVDNVLRNSISGEVDWTLQSYNLGAGSHALRWVYTKDGNTSSGSDCGWVDHVVLNQAGTFTLSLAKGGAGTGKVKVGGDPVPHGLPYQEAFSSGFQLGLEAVPDPGSLFTDWTGDLVSSANPAVITMDQNKTVAANFAPVVVYSLTVTAPNGGESWTVGSTHAITWTHTGPGGPVTIDLYKGGVKLKTLGAAEATDKTFSWTIAGGEAAGTDYRIVVWQGTVSDQSDADFAILSAARRVDFNKDGQEDILWRYQGTGDYQGLNLVWLMNQTGGAAMTPQASGQAAAGKNSPLMGSNSIVTSGASRAAGVQRNVIPGPKSVPKTLMNGRMATGIAPALIMKDPLGASRGHSSAKQELIRAVSLGNMLPRKDAANPGVLSSGGTEIAAIGLSQEVILSTVSDTAWEIAGTGDFDGDGDTDILWRHYGTGAYQGLNDVWFMNGTSFDGESVFSQVLDTNWRIAGTGDFSGDGDVDILWRYYGTGDYQGLNVVWYMNGATFAGETVFSAVTDTAWKIAGTGDFDGDGDVDILWRYYGTGDYQGLNVIWYMNGTTVAGETVFSQVMDTDWEIAGTGDFDGNGGIDILWRYYGTGAYQGLNVIWYLNGTTLLNEEVFGVIPDTNWRIVNR